MNRKARRAALAHHRRKRTVKLPFPPPQVPVVNQTVGVQVQVGLGPNGEIVFTFVNPPLAAQIGMAPKDAERFAACILERCRAAKGEKIELADALGRVKAPDPH
jgi:hypothetical protein